LPRAFRDALDAGSTTCPTGKAGLGPVGANAVLQTERGAAPGDFTQQEGAAPHTTSSRAAVARLAERVLGPVLARSRRGARPGELLK
jgi:hypothetical protein